MALGKAVVATDVLGTQELVVNKVTGFLVPLEDQSELHEAVVELIDNKELCLKMGKAGRQRVEQEFNEKNIVQLWIKRYGL